jgi:hypothetical protein
MPVVVRSQFQLTNSLSSPIAGTYGVVGFNERIVDGDNVNLVVLNGISEDDTTNTTEPVDSNLGNSHVSAASVS